MNTKKPAIAMRKVRSSQISELGYDPASNTLAVKFAAGGLYHYQGVTQEKFDALMKADSIGSHLGKHIKPSHKFAKQDK